MRPIYLFIYLFIPAEAHWNELKKVTENIGIDLDKAFLASILIIP